MAAVTSVRPAPRVRPLTLAALALVVGSVAGLHGVPGWFTPLALSIASLAGCAALIVRRRDVLVLACLSLIGLSGALMGAAVLREAAGDCRATWYSGQRVRVVGLALDYLPAGERGSVRLRPEVEPPTGCRWRGAVRLWSDGPFRPGASYRVTGEWQPVHGVDGPPRAPERAGWVAVRSAVLLADDDASRYPILATRAGFADRIWHVYPRRWAPLAAALILGQRGGVDPDVSRRIARAGLAHLLAISGLHVGLLAAALFGGARILRISPRTAHLAAAAGVVCYVLLIGAPASAVRAALMVSLWALSRLAGRPSSPFDVLGLSAVLLLLARPWSVLDPGFQLSFAGAGAVGYASREVDRFRVLRGRRAPVRAAVAGLVASAAVVALTAPITATHFGRVAPAAIPGNLVAIPLLGLAMPALFASLALSSWPALAAWPADAAVLLLSAIDGLAGLIGRSPWASIEVAPPGRIPALAYVVLLVLAAHAVHGAWQRRRLVLALGAAVALTIVAPSVRARLSGPGVEIHVLDVGQGDAIAVATPHRRWLLVDAGPRAPGFDAGERRVVPFLRLRGVRALDAWVLSHTDLDHVGGGPAVLDALPVTRVIGPGTVTGQPGQLDVLARLARDSLRWVRAVEGASFSVDGVTLTFLHPPAGGSEESGASVNAGGLVFRLDFGAFRMLFTGDAPGPVEDRLARRYGEALRSQVLKVAHHGSRTSSSGPFLDAVRPDAAVISAGRRNRYGHPSPRVLLRLAARGIDVRRTDREGIITIEVRSDGRWRLRSAAHGF